MRSGWSDANALGWLIQERNGLARGADIWLLARETLSPSYSNRRLAEEIARRGFRPAFVDPRHVDIRTDPFGASVYRHRGTVIPPPRAVFARRGARTGRRGRALVAALEAGGVACQPGSRGLSFGVDKLGTALALKEAGLPCPASVALEPGDGLERIRKTVGFPLVVKPLAGRQGQHVRLCRGAEEFAAIIARYGARRRLLAQAFVSTSAGRDLRILVAGGHVVAAMLREAPPGEFRSNVALGGRATAVFAPSAAVRLALEAMKTLELEIAAVDFLFGAEGLTICEVNVAPGFEALEAVTGQNIAGAMIGLLGDRQALYAAACANSFSS